MWLTIICSCGLPGYWQHYCALLCRKMPLCHHWCDINGDTAVWLTAPLVTLIKWYIHSWVFCFYQCFIWAFCIICPAEVIVQFSVYIILKALGLLNHINRLFQLHQCDHEMLANRFSWRFIEELTLATLFLQKIYLATFLAFLPQTMQPRNSSGKDQRNNKPHQKCWFIGFLKWYTNLTSVIFRAFRGGNFPP